MKTGKTVVLSRIRNMVREIELEFGEAFSVSVFNKNDWRLNHWMTPLYQYIV